MTRDEDKILVEQFLAALRAGADFRDRKVRRLRASIRAGAFENRLKLEIASDRLAAELIGGEGAASMTNDEGSNDESMTNVPMTKGAGLSS